ncbi:hypothetical protein V6N13_102970 [Hibiscus sabdariffa]
MGEIFGVVLARNNGARLRFHYGVVRVRDEKGGWYSWEFNCKSEGGGYFTISGPGWRAFANSRINAMLTLFKEQDDDLYTIRVSY